MRTSTPRLWASLTASMSDKSEKTNILMRIDFFAAAIASRIGLPESSGRTMIERDIALPLLVCRIGCSVRLRLGHVHRSCRHHFIRTGVELGPVEFGVYAVLRHKLIVGAAFGDAAALDHDNLVCVADRAQAMGDGDDRLTLHQFFERVNESFLRLAVKRRCGS